MTVVMYDVLTFCPVIIKLLTDLKKKQSKYDISFVILTQSIKGYNVDSAIFD